MEKITFYIICGLLFVYINLIAEDRRDTLLTDFENQSTYFTATAPGLSMQIAPNPDKSGENLSNYVLKIDANEESANWEALYTLNNTTNLRLNVNATNGYRYLHFKVHKNFNSGMLWGLYKQEGGNLTAKYPEQQWNSKTNEWEYIVVDLLRLTDSWNVTAGTYYRLSFAPDKTSSPRISYTMYLDDVYLSNSSEKIPSNSSDGYWNLVFEENFEGTSVNQSNWYMYNGGGHAGNGLRRPEAFSVADGMLTVTAQMKDGQLVSGGMGHRKNYKYGKFEFRIKADADPSGATSAVVLTWPQSEVWPDDGENDIFETHSSSNPNRTFFETNILSGAPKNAWSKGHYTIDATQWHTVAMEWQRQAINIYIDGNLRWTQSDTSMIVDKPHHICIQLDAFKTSMTGSSSMYIDWVKIYQQDIVSSVNAPEVKNAVRVFPNPVSSYINIQSPNIQSLKSIDIYSFDGSKVKSVEIATSRINCDDLKSGLYLLKVNFMGKQEIVKFIKK